MRDDEARATGHERLHGVDDGLLGARVHARGGLVQDEDGRVAEHGARDREQLALAGAHRVRIVGEHGVIAVRQGADEVVHVRRPGGLNDLVARGVGAPVGDVLGNRALEQPRVLQDHAKLTSEVLRAHPSRVDAVKRDAAAIDLVEAHEQVDERGLASARGAHDGHLLARLGHERDVSHERLVRAVAKAHVLEGHTTAYGFDGRERIGRVRLDLGLVEQGEHALGGGEGPLQHVDREAQLRERLGRLRHVLEERLEHANRKLAGDEHLTGEHRDRDLAQPHDEANRRPYGVRKEVRGGRGVRKALRGRKHLACARLVTAERLDDGTAAVGLLDTPRERAERRLPGRCRLKRARGEHLGHGKRDRRERQEDACEAHVHREHDEHGPHHRHDAREQLQHAALQDL